MQRAEQVVVNLVGRLSLPSIGQYSFGETSLVGHREEIGPHMTTVNGIEAGAESVGVRTIRKLRFRILPYLLVLYVIAYLDRINIGFAALTMNKELAISSQLFGMLVGIFFFGYFLFEIPSNLLLHKFGARVWIARILITWGIVAMLTGFVHSVHQLYVVRFLLGLAEAGYSPGIILYLTYWFPQRERARAIALFLTGLPITSILGAPISGLILDHVHWFGISSWRWLLVLEGVPAVIFGILTYFALPSRPSEAKFLNRRGEALDHSGIGSGRAANKAKTASLAVRGAHEPPSVASSVYRFHSQHRHVLAELLDAATREIAF
jgi:MFS family permease